MIHALRLVSSADEFKNQTSLLQTVRLIYPIWQFVNLAKSEALQGAGPNCSKYQKPSDASVIQNTGISIKLLNVGFLRLLFGCLHRTET